MRSGHKLRGESPRSLPTEPAVAGTVHPPLERSNPPPLAPVNLTYKAEVPGGGKHEGTYSGDPKVWVYSAALALLGIVIVVALGVVKKVTDQGPSVVMLGLAVVVLVVVALLVVTLLVLWDFNRKN